MKRNLNIIKIFILTFLLLCTVAFWIAFFLNKSLIMNSTILMYIGISLTFTILSIVGFKVSLKLVSPLDKAFYYSTEMFKTNKEFQLAAIGGLFVALILFYIELLTFSINYLLGYLYGLTSTTYKILAPIIKYTVGLLIIGYLLNRFYEQYLKRELK